MRVAIHDADQTKFPNLVLMKLSTYHKSHGDSVDFFSPLFWTGDIIYSSKVFTYTQGFSYQYHVQKGGIGYDMLHVLPDSIEHLCPDYELYKSECSFGFLTRGCIKKCPWCFVPKKEGTIKAHADIEEFARHRDVVLMDNNVLAHPHGIKQIEKIADMGLRIDFNQGIDATLIDNTIAKLFSKVQWLHPIRLACDTPEQINPVKKAIELLRWYNVTPRRYFCYVLVMDVQDAVDRVRFLKGMEIDPFAQPYRSPTGQEPTNKQRAFARWVNHKAEFKSRTWEEYWEAHCSVEDEEGR